MALVCGRRKDEGTRRLDINFSHDRWLRVHGRSTFLACGKLIGVSHDDLSNALSRSKRAPVDEQMGRDARYRRILARGD
jgi:hypothetical protein